MFVRFVSRQSSLWSVATLRCVPCRAFRATLAAAAAKKKGKDVSSDSDDKVVTLPDPKIYDGLMVKRLTALKDELSQIRGGSASKDMLNSISVSAYGSSIPLSEAGQITLKSPTSITVSIFDTALTQFIVNALKESNMNLNPIVEGSNIVISVPKPSKEQRELQTKLVGKIVEKTKQDIRNVRKEGLDFLKKLKGKVSEDDIRRITKSIDAASESNVEKASKMQKEKEKEVMTM